MKIHAMRDIIENMDTRDELIKLKDKTGLNWKKLSEYYGIPYRTVQDWYMGKRNMPEYLLRLMIYKAEMEKSIHGSVKGDNKTRSHDAG